MPELRAIIFDWGSTLADVGQEEQVWSRCARRAVDVVRQGAELPDDSEEALVHHFQKARQKSYLDPQHREARFGAVLNQWLGAMGFQLPDLDLRTELETAFWSEWVQALTLLDDADEVVAALRARGLIIGLCSNVVAPKHYCMEQLQRLGLREHIHIYTFSSEVGFRKPHHAVYQDVLSKVRRLAEPQLEASQVVFVGDSPTCDVVGPATAGMRTVLMTHPELESAWSAEQYARARPDHKISHLADLHKIDL